jgi:uncharacterized membrane protein YcjF (UPF0283 family)
MEIPESTKKTIKYLMDQHNKTQVSWSQHILLMSSSLFGIIIALHSNSPDMLCIRWVFALAVALLALGILTTATSLYRHSSNLKRLRKDYSLEASAALREHRGERPVFVATRKIFVVCEWLGYICLVLSVLLLALYAVLLAVC